MKPVIKNSNVSVIAAAIGADIQALPRRNTDAMRAVRREYSRRLASASPAIVVKLARRLVAVPAYRWIGYELIANHPLAFESLNADTLEELGHGLNSWNTVDEFGRTLSGPAWLKGLVPDALILKWARSDDLWWRRAALVSTVAWNMRSHGGPGDVKRTLRICRLLVKDREDMVVKAVSWALRVLVVHDAQAVRDFLKQYDSTLAPRVKREVNHKLRTGLKNPRLRR